MKTRRERQEEKRQDQLKEIQESIDAGTLVVRQMTPEERKKNPPKVDTSGRRPQRRAFR
jgi:hypothetical protein